MSEVEKLQQAGINASWSNGKGTFEFEPAEWSQASTVPFRDAALSHTGGDDIKRTDQVNKTITITGNEAGFTRVCEAFGAMVDKPPARASVPAVAGSSGFAITYET